MKKVNLICSVFLLFFVNYSFALDLPETPAGKRAKEIIELLNESSSFKLGDYINHHYAPSFRDAFPVEVHKEMIHRTHTMFGQLKVIEITKSAQNEISIVLKSELKDACLNLMLQLESEDTNRILMVGFRPGSCPTDIKKNKEDKFSNLEELQHYLLKKTIENEFSGSVLVAKDGIPIFEKAYGQASINNNIANNTDTKFNLGSINKIFTTIAIAQLMEKGKLSLEDPIGKYLDVFPDEIASKVTIRHLLDMRSGWGDYWSNEYYLAHKEELKTMSDYLGFIKDIPLDFEPGTSRQHCNIGYEVAGAIIEKISGMNYFDYIKKNIYDIAGMKNTDSYYRDAEVENRAIGYVRMKPNGPAKEISQPDNQNMLPL